MVPPALRAALEGLQPPVTDPAAERLGTLFGLLREWDGAGLTGFRDEAALAQGYFREALELRGHLPAPGPVLDIGSGGGTPALPLAAVTDRGWTLLEPRRSASVFLELAVRKLDLAGRVKVERKRLGDWLDSREPGSLPFAAVTLRAVRLTRREWKGLAAALPAGAVVVWPTTGAARRRAECPEGILDERAVPATRGIVWLGTAPGGVFHGKP